MEQDNSYSFLESAKRILKEEINKKTMHYSEITRLALEKGYLATEGKTPEATMSAQLSTIVKKESNQDIFYKDSEKRGYYGLVEWLSKGLAQKLQEHEKETKKVLLEKLKDLDPYKFEKLIGTLLSEMGFEDVEVTQQSRDGGIDIRGVLLVGDVIRTKMAVQVKRYKNSVSDSVVRELRGSLNSHEQGLIITTGVFTKPAQEEANCLDKQPISLMDGNSLVELLLEHSIGVNKIPYNLYEITDFEL